MNRNTNWSLGM